MGHADSELIKEVTFSTSRSSGAGGQNVNKVNTKVELRFNITYSQCLTDEQKDMIYARLAGRINTKGELVITSQDERSQLQNKENVIRKFVTLIEKAITPVKKRRKTKPSKASKEKRLESKKLKSEKKNSRKNIRF